MLVQAIGKTSNSVEQVVFITNGVHRIPSSHTCCRNSNALAQRALPVDKTLVPEGTRLPHSLHMC